jgi:hypothetical protein
MFKLELIKLPKGFPELKYANNIFSVNSLRLVPENPGIESHGRIFLNEIDLNGFTFFSELNNMDKYGLIFTGSHFLVSSTVEKFEQKMIIDVVTCDYNRKIIEGLYYFTDKD